MYKKCLKTYKFMLRYVFMVLGIIFLAFLIGGSIAINNSKTAVSDMVKNISTITKDSDLSFDGVRDAIITTINDTSAKEHVNNIKDDGLTGATDNILDKAVEKVAKNYSNYAEEVSEEVGTTVMKFLFNFIVFIVIQIVGVIIGENVVAIVAGREILQKSSNSIKGSILNRICRWGYKLLVIGLIALTLSLVPIVGIILLLAYPLISCFLAILSRYYISVKDKSSFSKIVNARNVFTLFAVDLTCIAISIVISLVVMAIIGGFTAFYILLSLLAVTNASVRLNAYQFAEEKIEEVVVEAE